jgi:hypothetical protein
VAGLWLILREKLLAKKAPATLWGDRRNLRCLLRCGLFALFQESDILDGSQANVQGGR